MRPEEVSEENTEHKNHARIELFENERRRNDANSEEMRRKKYYSIDVSNEDKEKIGERLEEVRKRLLDVRNKEEVEDLTEKEKLARRRRIRLAEKSGYDLTSSIIAFKDNTYQRLKKDHPGEGTKYAKSTGEKRVSICEEEPRKQSFISGGKRISIVEARRRSEVYDRKLSKDMSKSSEESNGDNNWAEKRLSLSDLKSPVLYHKRFPKSDPNVKSDISKKPEEATSATKFPERRKSEEKRKEIKKDITPKTDGDMRRTSKDSVQEGSYLKWTSRVSTSKTSRGSIETEKTKPGQPSSPGEEIEEHFGTPSESDVVELGKTIDEPKKPSQDGERPVNNTEVNMSIKQIRESSNPIQRNFLRRGSAASDLSWEEMELAHRRFERHNFWAKFCCCCYKRRATSSTPGNARTVELLKALTETDFQNCFEHWKIRLHRCVDRADWNAQQLEEARRQRRRSSTWSKLCCCCR